MFDEIIALIEQGIRAELAKEKLDIVAIKSLIEIEQYVQMRSIDSVDDMGPRFPMGQPGVARTYPVPHGPSAMERATDEALSLIQRQVVGFQQPTLITLAESFAAVRDTEPELAGRIKVLLEQKIKSEEDRNADLHPELSG